MTHHADIATTTVLLETDVLSFRSSFSHIVPWAFGFESDVDQVQPDQSQHLVARNSHCFVAFNQFRLLFVRHVLRRNGTRNRVRAKDSQLQKRRLAYSGSCDGYPLPRIYRGVRNPKPTTKPFSILGRLRSNVRYATKSNRNHVPLRRTERLESQAIEQVTHSQNSYQLLR